MKIGVKIGQGYRPGYADLIIDRACGPYHGCRIELKTESGEAREAQLEVRTKSLEEGYYYTVTKG